MSKGLRQEGRRQLRQRAGGAPSQAFHLLSALQRPQDPPLGCRARSQPGKQRASLVCPGDTPHLVQNTPGPVLFLLHQRAAQVLPALPFFSILQALMTRTLRLKTHESSPTASLFLRPLPQICPGSRYDMAPSLDCSLHAGAQQRSVLHRGVSVSRAMHASRMLPEHNTYSINVNRYSPTSFPSLLRVKRFCDSPPLCHLAPQRRRPREASFTEELDSRLL